MKDREREDPHPDHGQGPPEGKGKPSEPGRPVRPHRSHAQLLEIYTKKSWEQSEKPILKPVFGFKLKGCGY